MRQKARNADTQYWERVQEWTQEQAYKQPQQKAQQQPVTSSSSTSRPSTQPRSTDSKTADAKTGPTPAKPSKLAGKLNSKGKLTPQERQNHISKNLCMYCGGTGHKASDCPHAKAAKAKAATASESGSKPKDPVPEQKKG